MNSQPFETHKKQVELWEDKNTKGLSAKKIVQLFGAAIHAIEQRSLFTLSSITVTVVADRVLYESTDKFPILAGVKIEPKGMSLAGLLDQSEKVNPEELRNALHHLLVELLTVLGNITADILTAPLHAELMQVTREGALKDSGTQNLRAVNSAKTDREDT
jgi:hypothetical protein